MRNILNVDALLPPIQRSLTKSCQLSEGTTGHIVFLAQLPDLGWIEDAKVFTQRIVFDLLGFPIRKLQLTLITCVDWNFDLQLLQLIHLCRRRILARESR